MEIKTGQYRCGRNDFLVVNIERVWTSDEISKNPKSYLTIINDIIRKSNLEIQLCHYGYPGTCIKDCPLSQLRRDALQTQK